jgi:hypothetical protein
MDALKGNDMRRLWMSSSSKSSCTSYSDTRRYKFGAATIEQDGVVYRLVGMARKRVSGRLVFESRYEA